MMVAQRSDELSMLAFVHWIRSPETLGNNIKFFRNFGETSVINVTAIDRCVGFLEVAANKYEEKIGSHLDDISFYLKKSGIIRVILLIQ